MNFHFPFFGRREAQPLRAIVATRAESLAARRRAADRLLELAVYKATTTPAQRKAEADAWFARRAAIGRAVG